jgi:tRNA threonylcarbamoyladenosine modification (KEOPS) complex  Pcc1 subunit
MLWGMAEGIARWSYTAVTSDMRDIGRSTGRVSLTRSIENIE